MNAERGHANIQGNTDHAISWENLPGYLRIPRRARRRSTITSRRARRRRATRTPQNFSARTTELRREPAQGFGIAGRRSPRNDFAFNSCRSRRTNSSWMSIYDQALKGKMEGGAALRHDRDEHRSGQQSSTAGALESEMARWSWTRCPRRAPSSGRRRASMRRRSRPSLHAADHALDREGRVVHQQRTLGSVEGAGDPAGGEARHDQWILADLFDRVEDPLSPAGREVRIRCWR